MKVTVQAVQTLDGVQTIIISPAVSRRQKANWQVWIKPDGSGNLSIDTTLQHVDLPANSPRDGEK